jgi:hypothetical protein
MEINYDLIIKYLAKNQLNNENSNILTNKNFPTQKSIYNYSTNFPERFRDLLSDKFYRYGITMYSEDKINISFWSSFLTIVDMKFMIPYNMDEITMIGMMKEQLLELYNKQKHIKLIDKAELRERFKTDIDITGLQYIVNVMDINMIIFNFETNDINVLYKNDIMNPWKPIILFAKYDRMWEPILMIKSKGEIQRTFDYNNIHIKKILQTEGIIKYYDNIKDFVYIDIVDDVVTNEKNNLCEKLIIIKKEENPSEVETEDEEINNMFIKKEKSLTKDELTKMKVIELTELATKMNIVLPKRAIKSVIIESILCYSMS